MRRPTRFTNGFSKNLENRIRILSLYCVHSSFVRVHKTRCMTPAMAADVACTHSDLEWIVGLIDANAPAPEKRGLYKKRHAENSI